MWVYVFWWTCKNANTCIYGKSPHESAYEHVKIRVLAWNELNTHVHTLCRFKGKQKENWQPVSASYVQRHMHMRMNEYLRAKAHAYEWMLTCKGTCVWMRKILMCRGTCIWMNSMRIGLPRRPISTVNLISGEITGWEEPVTGSIWETACTHIQGKEPSHGT